MELSYQYVWGAKALGVELLGWEEGGNEVPHLAESLGLPTLAEWLRNGAYWDMGA